MVEHARWSRKMVARVRRDLSAGISVCTFVFLVTAQNAVLGAVPSEIEISAEETSIGVGEPLILKMRYTWPEPIVDDARGECSKEVLHHAKLWVLNTEKGLKSRYPIVSPSTLKPEDKGCRNYSEDFVIFFALGGAQPVFREAGAYRLQAEGWTIKSNWLNVEVGAGSEAGMKALSLLSDPNDLLLLAYGVRGAEEGFAQRLSRLRLVADECQGAVLADWCAARAGLEYFEQFRSRHGRYKEVKALYKEGAIRDEALDLACEYLSRGAAVPVQLGVRPEVLFKHFVLEDIRENYDAALEAVNELINTYPDSKYGKQALAAKDRLERLSNAEPEQSKRSREVSGSNAGQEPWLSRAVLLVVVGAIGIGVVGVGFILLLRKKLI